jgi:hypothetical protein
MCMQASTFITTRYISVNYFQYDKVKSNHVTHFIFFPLHRSGFITYFSPESEIIADKVWSI